MISPSAQVYDSPIPWKAEPFRLWSLHDMLQFYAASFYTAATLLERARFILAYPGSIAAEGDPRDTVARILQELDKSLKELPLPKSVLAAPERIGRYVKDKDAPATALIPLINELQHNLQIELQEHLFFCVPSERSDMFLQPSKWFGEDVAAKFGDAVSDMRGACRCLALTQWAASVFHAMRIFEHGLRFLTARVSLPPLDHQNWHNVIEQIDKKLREMKQDPKRDEKEITFCSNAASHFFAVKEAWRNHISHGRGSYDEAEAVRVLDNVRDFMQALAA